MPKQFRDESNPNSMSSVNKVVNPAGSVVPSEENDTKESRLVTWITDRVTRWEQHRDANYKKKWDMFYRFWKGIHTSEDKTRDSERSTLISPALAQAIEAETAELEEATFARKNWFDIEDDLLDDDQIPDAEKIRNSLLERFELDGVPEAIVEVFLNGAIYGTGIAKIIPEEFEDKKIVSQIDESGDTVDGVAVTDKIRVRVEPIQPDEFVIDSSVTRPGREGIKQALGMAHILIKPRHEILAKQGAGLYKNVHIGNYDQAIDNSAKGEVSGTDPKGKVKIIEYYGLVPKDLLESGIVGETEEINDDNLVEAICTIGNDTVLLRAVENPYIMQDRPIVAYQHDTVPNKFWGRGVAEKGMSPARALNAILRAQMDGLALTIHPMMSGDASRLPRGFNLTVHPGKHILTNGPPKEVLSPINFGKMDTSAFTSASDLERQIQMGTGAMDSASPLRTNRRNETASGMSMIGAASAKRSKRTLQNIGRHFLSELVKKAAWRYMQLDPDNFPAMDLKFKVVTSLGMMAREIEVQQLVNLLQIVPPETPAFPAILSGIMRNSSLDNKDEIVKAIDQMFTPDPESQRKQNQEAADTSAAKQAATAESQSRTQKNNADAAVKMVDAVQKGKKSQQELQE